jgi:hypothetical protein
MSAPDAKSPVVGELDLTVPQAAVFSKSLGELLFLFSTLLAGSHGLRRSCAVHVPFAAETTWMQTTGTSLHPVERRSLARVDDCPRLP